MNELEGIKQAFRFLLRKEMEREIEQREIIVGAWKWKNDDYRQKGLDKERIKIETKYRYLFDGLREKKVEE
jgi:hypothetical protein